MESNHYHWDCPLCLEEAIPERCPGFRIEWVVILEEEMNPYMVRVWFLDGTYLDGLDTEMEHWKTQPDYSRTVSLFDEEEGDEQVRVENGKRQV